MHEVQLLPKQWEVFTSAQGVDYDIKLYQGGVGSGKTFLGSLKGLKVLSENHGATWLVASDTWSRLRDTTWKMYLELLDAAKLKHKANKSEHTITIPQWDNSVVIFKGIDDPFALRSVNGIGGHLEEASLLSEASYLEFLGRLRQSKGDVIQLVLTTNPQASKGWLFDHFVKRGGVSEATVRGNRVITSRRRVIARTLDNPYVPDAFIAMMKDSYDEELWRIMVLGEDGDYTRGLVCYNFSDNNIIDTEYKPDLDLYLTCDFNVDPMSWGIAHRYNKEYHFVDEIVIENTNIDECVDEFVTRYPNHKGRIIITGDASGRGRNVQNDKVGGTSYTSMVNRFAFHEYPVHPSVDVRDSNPAIMDRIRAFNAKMCNTNGVRGIFINPRCKWLIHNLQNLKFKEGSSQIETPTHNQITKDNKSKFLGHIYDAASYLIEKYDPIIFTMDDQEDDYIVETDIYGI